MTCQLWRRTRTSTILIVDDDEGVTQTFARMLRSKGIQVRTALNAETGLRAAGEAHPDAIILDLRMPLVDGLGFLRRLRARRRASDATPVAIVTGDYFLDDAVVDRAARSWAPSCGSSRSGSKISSASRATCLKVTH